MLALKRQVFTVFGLFTSIVLPGSAAEKYQYFNELKTVAQPGGGGGRCEGSVLAKSPRKFNLKIRSF